MIALIIGTNRPESKSKVIGNYISELLRNREQEVGLIDLYQLPSEVLTVSMYDPAYQSPYLSQIQDNILVPAKKWWVVSPEYNGSYAGVLKLFVDAISVRKYKESFKGGKKMALTGVASGRGGNLRGLDHLTTSFNYLGFHILPNRLPLANVGENLSEMGHLSDDYKVALEDQVDQFLSF